MTFTKKLFTESKEKGVALIIAIFTLVIISYLVVEISYESNVEYIVNANAVTRLKAYYAARSGMEISLLRIKIYNKAQAQFGSQIPPAQKKMLDMIWSFPFAWPPTIPDDALDIDKGTVEDAVKESKMDAEYNTTIIDEGSKIDINDLASPSKGLREGTRKLLLGIFENRLENDEEWARENDDLEFEKVINNITDWVDDDRQAINGGDERSQYVKISPDLLPPNRAFRTIDEVRMVAGMTPEIFNMLKSRITVYGMKAINPNYASKEILMSIDISITDKVASDVIARRDNDEAGGPFKDANDFWEYVRQSGGNVSQEKQEATPIVTENVHNFRIKSVGTYSNVSREIEAVVFDPNSSAKVVADNLKREMNTTTTTLQGQTATTNPNQTKEPLPKGPPRIVYWMER